MRAQGDGIITRAKARMVVASGLVTKAERELRAASREIKRHPECRASKGRGAERITLAWWLLDCIESVLDEMSLHEGAAWLRSDGRHPERSLRELVDQERREAAARARRKGGRAAR